MRIDCEQCGAAFSIDDALISERGVRAQCPKCGHQKVVRKPPAAAAPAPSGGPRPITAVSTQVPPSLQNQTTQSNPNPFATATQPNSNPFAAPSTLPSSAGNPFAQPDFPSSTFPPQASSSSPFPPPSTFPPQAAAPSFPPQPPPSFGAPEAAPNHFGGGGGANPFGGPPRAANPFQAPSPGPEATLTSSNPFMTQTSPPSATATGSNPFGAPFSGAPTEPSGNPFAAPSSSPPSAASADPFAALGADPFAAALGPPPADPFGALGAGAAPPVLQPPPVPPPRPAPSASAPDPFAKLAQSPARPAMTFQAGPMNARAPEPPADPFAGMGPSPSLAGGGAAAPDPFDRPPDKRSGGDPFANLDLDPNAGAPAVHDIDRAPPPSAPLNVPRKSAASQVRAPGPSGSGARSRGPSFRLLAGIAVAVVVVGGLGGVYVFKPELFEKTTDAGVNPLRRAKQSWEKQFPDVNGTALDHVAAAKAQMRMDTAAGYRKADDELRQALLLDIGNTTAIAAWVENFSNLPAVKGDLEGTSLASEAIAYARKKEPNNVDVARADGALRLALGEVDAAQKVLFQAHAANPASSETTLVLAMSHLDRNPQDALDLVQEVRGKDPTLKHALAVEGAAQRRLGNFKEARDVLMSRLIEDPSNTAALKEIAKLELDVGSPEAAISALTKLLDAEDRDVEAHLMRAKIAYQALDDPDALKRADGYLDLVLKNHDTTAGELLLPVLSHAAYVKAELGNLDQALKLAERARATDASYAPALFVLGRVHALKGNLEEAKKDLEKAVQATQAHDNFYEPVARAELARVMAASGDASNAIRNYEQVIEYDPRYTRAHFGLASTYMASGKVTEAMTIMRRAFENDPAWEAEHRLLTDYPTPKRDLLVFADNFKNARVPAGDEEQAALKLASEGMIRYAAGQIGEAEALEKKTLADDRFNDVALMYLGLIELGDGRALEARKHLRLGADTTGKNHHITHLYLARAQMKTGELEAAKVLVQDVIDQEPTLVQAQFTQAMILRQQHLEAQALDLLKKVVKIDQDYMPAKRALSESP